MGCVDHIRKNKKVTQLKKEYEKFIDFYDDGIPPGLTIHEIIDTLNEDEKGVIILKFYYEYTFKEISKILEIPLGTAKSILYRALKKLRNEYLKGDDYNEQ